MTGPGVGKAARGGFNPNIHGARGLFSSAVFVFHVANSGLMTPVPYPHAYALVTSALAYGVELFFIISGIVILGAFRRAPDAATFIIDRVTRIFPVLWLAVTAMFILNLLGTDRFDTGSPIQTVAVYVGNLFAMPPVVRIPLIHGAAWSLSYEFAFYLLFVLFGLLAGFVRRPIAIALTFLVAIGVYWIHVRAIFFVPGLIIAAGWMRQPRWEPLVRHPFLWMLVFLVAWQTVAVMVGGNIHAAIFTRLLSEPLLLALAAVAFVSALLCMAGIEQGRGWLSALLRRPVMQWLGTISFSFYLWQTPVMAIVKHAMYASGLADSSGVWAQPLFFVLALPPTLIVSFISQRVVEVGATNWLRARRPVGEPTHLRPEKPA